MAKAGKEDGRVTYLLVWPEDAEFMASILKEDMAKAAQTNRRISELTLERYDVFITEHFPPEITKGFGLLDQHMVAFCTSDDRVYNVPWHVCRKGEGTHGKKLDAYIMNAVPEVVKPYRGLLN